MFAGIGIFFQERLRLHDESRSTDPTLQGRIIQERILERVERSVAGHSFNRLDLGPLDFHGQNQAAHDGPAVQMDRAGAAVAVGAAFLRTRHIEIVAQSFQQSLPRLAEKFLLSAVDRGADDAFLGHEVVS